MYNRFDNYAAPARTILGREGNWIFVRALQTRARAHTANLFTGYPPFPLYRSFRTYRMVSHGPFTCRAPTTNLGESVAITLVHAIRRFSQRVSPSSPFYSLPL